MSMVKGGAGDPSTREALNRAIRVLEVFSARSHLSFDRMLCTRILDEAIRAIPGTDANTWLQRLVEVGESLNLRALSVDCTLAESLSFVRQGIPVATSVEQPDGRLKWYLIDRARTWRVRLAAMDDTEQDRWVRISRLSAELGIDDRSATLRWIVGQPALGCSHNTQPHRHDRHGDHGSRQEHHIEPLSRLLQFMRLESRDIAAIVVFSLVTGMLTLATPIAVEALVNTVAFGRYLQPVVVLAIILFTFLGFAALIRALMAYVVEIIQRRLFVRVVSDLAYRLPRVRQIALDQVYGPSLANQFFDVVTVQKVTASLLLDGIAIVLQTMMGMLVLAFYHPFLLGFDLMLLLLIAFVIFGLGRGAIRTAIKESKAKYSLAAWLEDLVRFPTAFKLHGGNQFGLDRSDHLAIDWLSARRAHFHVVLRQILFALGLQAVAATALLGLGGWLVIRGQLTLGQLVAAELIVMLIVSSFAKIGKHMESFYDLMASVDELGELFDLPIEEHDNLFHLRGGVPAQLRVLDVSYHFGSHAVLSGVSLELSPGEAVALIGPPGSGKSTLLELICGLRSPTDGHIELDGIDLRELRPDSMREHMALARMPEVFHGSVDENVHLNRLHISARDVRESVSAVGLLEEILRLPDGLNTQLRTCGAPLTTSQMVRLVLARAIVDRTRLLLIDGTLDLLPDELLGPILANLRGPDVPWTLLVATGRRAVVEACDRVISLGMPGHEAAERSVDTSG